MPKEVKKLTTGTLTITDGQESFETYNLSCLMRIADATEAMAANYTQMRADKERYERWYNEEVKKTRKLEASNASLRGVITRMKNKKKREAAQELAAS